MGFIAYAEAASPASSASALTASLLPIALVLLIAVLIWFKAAKNMAGLAADKGYTEKKWFHYCFWLGLVGFLMVCAMPDKKRGR